MLFSWSDIKKESFGAEIKKKISPSNWENFHVSKRNFEVDSLCLVFVYAREDSLDSIYFQQVGELGIC